MPTSPVISWVLSDPSKGSLLGLAHDLQLVPKRGQRVDHLLEMHELPVLRADAVVVQNPHATHVLAIRLNSASCIWTDGPQAKRRA